MSPKPFIKLYTEYATLTHLGKIEIGLEMQQIEK